MKDRDREIWKEFLRGNHFAFEVLLHKYYKTLFVYGSYFQSDKEQLADDVHDLMIDLWEKRDRLAEAENPKLYLFTALKHQIFRNKKKKKDYWDLDEVNHDSSSFSFLERFDFIESEHLKQRNNAVQLALYKLTPRQREVLHLRFFEDLTNEQIAHIMSISKEAVANLLSVSLRAFRSLWRVDYVVMFCITEVVRKIVS